MSRQSASALLLAGLLVACADQNSQPLAPSVRLDATAQVSAETRELEGLARRFAKALRNPAFRAEVKSRMDASSYPEHKIQLQRFLGDQRKGGVKTLARENAEPEQVTDSVVRTTRALEAYLPVPGHRQRWTGDERLLVATQARDGELVVAYDLRGGRHFLDPGRPPETPVLAVVPVETDFDAPPPVQAPGGATCATNCGGGGGSVLAQGLYLTKAAFNSTFEGWLKGDPEFEIHIMGQLGTTDSLTDYQCAGEHAAPEYSFDQNGTTWTGSVMLFSMKQIADYKAYHPGNALRIVALEDDDTACKIKIDQNRWNKMVSSFDSAYKDFTGATDNGTVPNWVKAAKSLADLLAKIASWIKSNDDLIGNAIENKIAGQYNTGYNWVVKDGTKTNGWLNLEMR